MEQGAILATAAAELSDPKYTAKIIRTNPGGSNLRFFYRITKQPLMANTLRESKANGFTIQ